MSAEELVDGRRLRGSVTRAKAIEAAAELFAAQGYSATSMGSIASAAGIHSASIYHAFGSKEGLLGAVVEHASDEFYHLLREQSVSSGSLRDGLRGVGVVFEKRPLFLKLLLMLVLERGDGDPGVLRIAADVRLKGRALIRDLLSRQVPAGTGTDLDAASRLIMVALDGAFIARQVDMDASEFTTLMDLIAETAERLLTDTRTRPNRG
uniref:Transcriptional regulator, TetR family n=2 Tax=unclassified Mycobacterium TaxID=2642494 RepID=A0A5Q5BK61_MYCSS